MQLKSLSVAALALSAALVGTTAAADTLKFGKSEDAIKYRQNALFLISQHFGSLGAMANGRAAFDADVAKQNGAVLETLAGLPWQGFAAGTEGGKTKPEVWTEKAKFDGHADKFVAEAGKLAAAAKTGDLAQLKAAFGPAAQTCKACHDAFRNR
jgi:cytochrome c556